jgi:sec-independent protein translocase protein TatA
MNFGNLGFMEILLILVVVLLLFGAKRIPEIASSFGKGIKEFKKSVNDVDRDVRESITSETRRDRVPADERDRLMPGGRETRVEEETRPEPKRLI